MSGIVKNRVEIYLAKVYVNIRLQLSVGFNCSTTLIADLVIGSCLEPKDKNRLDFLGGTLYDVFHKPLSVDQISKVCLVLSQIFVLEQAMSSRIPICHGHVPLPQLLLL